MATTLIIANKWLVQWLSRDSWTNLIRILLAPIVLFFAWLIFAAYWYEYWPKVKPYFISPLPEAYYKQAVKDWKNGNKQRAFFMLTVCADYHNAVTKWCPPKQYKWIKEAKKALILLTWQGEVKFDGKSIRLDSG